MKRVRHPENALPFVLALAAWLLAGCSGDTPAGPGLTPASEVLEASAAAQGGFVILEPPETPGRPLYVGIIPVPELTTDAGETLLPFFRERSCIPEDANLLPPYNIEAGACPPTMHMKEWWLPEDLAVGGPDPWDVPLGDPEFRVPVQERYTGDAVPVWVVSLEGVLAAAADGVVTIGELEALQPIEGTATRFHAVLQNSNRATSTPSMRPNHSKSEVRGMLEDGRTFRHQFEERQGQFNHAEFVIE